MSTFTPRPGAAPLPRMVLAQARMEARLMVRNGEQLLLAVVIPVIVLVGMVRGAGRLGLDYDHPVVDVVTPGVLALAVLSTSFTSLAIATGFERRYGILKRLGASPLPRSGLLAGKVGALLMVEVLQLAGALGRRRSCSAGTRRPVAAALLGAALAVLLGTAAFASLGLLMAGALRAEATLAAANLVYLLLLAAGAVILPASAYGAFGDVAQWLPSGALGEAMRLGVPRRHRRLARPGRAARLGRGRHRRHRPDVLVGVTDRWMRPLAWATLVANIGLVVTGGAVRLTGSGLGCPTWPRCTDRSFRPHGELDLHQAIEFGNRMLTFVLVAIAVATFVVAWRTGRRDLRNLALIVALGIPAQAVIGGITVLTDLNPWVVSFHLLCSLAIIGVAVRLLLSVDAPLPPAHARPGGRPGLGDVRLGVGGALRRDRGHRLRAACGRHRHRAQRHQPAAGEPAPRRPGVPLRRAHPGPALHAAGHRRRRRRPAARSWCCSPSRWPRARSASCSTSPTCPRCWSASTCSAPP